MAKKEGAKVIDKGKDLARENMANFKVPRRVEKVPALPRNAMGKVLKFELRQRALQASRKP